jgi:hypothetical protein
MMDITITDINNNIISQELNKDITIDIQKMMNNDVSLKNIASLEQIKNLNLYYLRCPQLFLDTDIDYNLYSFDISNFMK